MQQYNVLGGALEECGTDPMTGYTRTGCCEAVFEEDYLHTICTVVTADFLEHQRETGNDLVTARPEFGFPGLVAGDRWCVVAPRWMTSHLVGRAAPVVLAATHRMALSYVPLDVLRSYAVDVPDDPGSLGAG